MVKELQPCLVEKQVRLGLIYFRNDHDEKLVAFAMFSDGECLKCVYNKQSLEQYIHDAFGDLYMVPEYLDHVIAGMMESFWNDFLCNVSENTFIKFVRVKDYTVEEFGEVVKDMLPYIRKEIEEKEIKGNVTFPQEES